MNNIASKDALKRLSEGIRLSETPMGIGSKGSLMEAKGWKEMVEGITDTERRSFTALMLENYKNSKLALDETTSTINVGNFDKYALPLLSIISENLIAQDLVSVQALDGPSGLIFYLNIITGQGKGDTSRGASVWDSRTGHSDRNSDSADRVDNEFVGVTDGSGFMQGTFAYDPVVPGTVYITVDPDGVNSIVTDDGTGQLIDSGAAVVGTINYNNGQITGTAVPAGTGSGDEYVATYNYNPEMNNEAQQLDLELQSSPIYTRERKLRARWTVESGQALDALHSVNAEDILTTSIANHLQWEIDREIIEDLRKKANAGVVKWSASIPTNSYISYTEHKLSFVDAMVTASGFIQRATNRAKANWALFGTDGSNVIETLPQFEPTNADTAEIEGVAMTGKLGRMKIYSDPHYPISEGLLGYKGADFTRAGYVFAPWILLFSTPTITLDDFINRKGLASQYGKKLVNSKMYSRIKLSNFDASFGG